MLNNLSDTVRFNDLIILYGGYGNIYLVKLIPGGITNSKYGSYKHEDIVGRNFGTKIFDNITKKWLAILHPTAEFITLTAPHRTQILYHGDISLILMLLDAKPGKFIIETGTGSGSLSVSIARAISPGGHLFTYEIHDDRYSKAKEAFDLYDLNKIITVKNSDVYNEGFDSQFHNKIDSIFLDLPAPWLVIYQCSLVLKDGGHLVNFSPCIEQVKKVNEELLINNFTGMRTFEILAKPWGVSINTAQINKNDSNINKKANIEQNYRNKDKEVLEINDGILETPKDYYHYQLPIRSHTGYLTVCRKSIGFKK